MYTLHNDCLLVLAGGHVLHYHTTVMRWTRMTVSLAVSSPITSPIATVFILQTAKVAMCRFDPRSSQHPEPAVSVPISYFSRSL